MLERSAERHDFNPESLAADKAYGTGAFLAWLLDKEIAPHVPVLDRKHQTKGKLSKDTTAAILTSGLLGEQYVGLTTGGDPETLEDGDTIRDTQSALVLEELIQQFVSNFSKS